MTVGESPVCSIWNGPAMRVVQLRNAPATASDVDAPSAITTALIVVPIRTPSSARNGMSRRYSSRNTRTLHDRVGRPRSASPAAPAPYAIVIATGSATDASTPGNSPIAQNPARTTMTTASVETTRP